MTWSVWARFGGTWEGKACELTERDKERGRVHATETWKVGHVRRKHMTEAGSARAQKAHPLVGGL